MRKITIFLILFLVLTLFKNSKQEDYSTDESDLDSDYPIDSTDITNGTTPVNETKLFLLGFGRFNRPRREKIEFKVYFKRVGIIPMPPFLIFTIIINYSTILRALEEESVLTNCSRIGDDDLTRDNIDYNCNAPIDENKNFTTIESKGDYNINATIEETTLAMNANIAEQTGSSLEQEAVELMEGILTQDSTTFTIEGKVINDTFSENQITLILEDDGEKKEIPCSVSTSGDNYKLVCTPKTAIKNSTLENAIGLGTDRNILIHMAEGNQTISFEPKGTPISNNYSRKKSSGGLTGGAIAGIVIACVAVAIALIITALLLRRSSVKTNNEESNLNMYTSESQF